LSPAEEKELLAATWPQQGFFNSRNKKSISDSSILILDSSSVHAILPLTWKL
jgi:hypothetical protein